MKVLFICGSSESGRDGVGDYTLRLAGELLRMGHVVTVVAINDPYLEAVSNENQDADGTRVAVLRLPATTGDDERFRLAACKLKTFCPDWVSLQFVPFSFHPKGLSLTLTGKMATLVSEYKFNIMFHELWVGLNSKVKFKMLLLGLAQKILIKRLLRQLKPDSITTSILAYKHALSEFHIKILPLFSNVPITLPINCTTQVTEYLKVVHFGSFSGATEDFKQQLHFLVEAAKFCSKEIQFLTIGEGGAFKENAMMAVKEVIGENRIVDLGRLSVVDISCILQVADVGISRANYALSGKSGSTLAMIEHGLPVLLRGNERDMSTSHTSSNDRQLFFCDSKFQKVLEKWPSKSGLKQTTKMFVEFLTPDGLLVGKS
jgi:hypothetical protein